MLVARSVLLGLVPIVAQPFLSLSVSAFDDLVSGRVASARCWACWRSSRSRCCMLGAVSPWAIRLKLEKIEDSGETAGRMYAISTVGSLLGTFLSALLLIPLVGTQRTFLVLRWRSPSSPRSASGRRWALVPLGVAALLALPIGTVKASGEGKVIHEAETEYQYARVIDHAGGERTLELNEGQAIHSLYRPDTVLTDGYWDGFLVAPFAVRRDPPRRVAMLGFAGGTVARAYAKYFPDARIDGVEIDSELFDIGRRYFGLRPRPQLHEYGEDARPFLRRIDARYDVIYLDTYRQPYIPFYLSTKEFFKLARSRLAPGGVVVVNLGHPEGSDELEKVLSATMGTAFTHVVRDPMEPTNTILMASRVPITRANMLAASRTPPGGPAPARPALGRAARAAAARRHRLHRRQGAGRVAGGQVDRRVRRGRRLGVPPGLPQRHPRARRP